MKEIPPVLDLQQIRFIRERGPKGTVRVRAVAILESVLEYDPVQRAKVGHIVSDQQVQAELVKGLWTALYGDLMPIVSSIPPQATKFHVAFQSLLIPDLSNLPAIQDFKPNGQETKPNTTNENHSDS